MFILGLTGSIGMGKSEIANFFRHRRVPVFDADAVARKVTAPGGLMAAQLAAVFPGAMVGGELDRAKLSEEVFADQDKRALLEGLIHPVVRQAERCFLRGAKRRKKDLAILEIPLLFETSADRRCDAICVVTAPRKVQMARVLKRPNMSQALFEKIEKSQMPDEEKRRRADFIINTGSSLAETKIEVYALLHALRRRARIQQRKHSTQLPSEAFMPARPWR